MIDLKDQTFGMELEFTGITREKAASVLAEYFGGRIFENDDDYYPAYGVYSSDNRRWNIVRDCSINPVGYEVGDYDEDYQCELVTPICKYEDIETVQEIVRELKKAGAKVNGSCGLHVHIGGDKHDVQSLTRLSFNMWEAEDMLFHSLNVRREGEVRWCKRISQKYIDLLKERKPQSKQELADCWYVNTYGDRNDHYHDSRYRALNLHSYFTKGTVEFRCFNATFHAGAVKSYIQLALAMSAQAINQERSNPNRKIASANESYTFREWLLNLSLGGDEFRTARYHLLKNFEERKDFREWRKKDNAIQRRADSAAEARARIDRMRDEQGQPLTAEQIITQPDREDVFQGLTTRQQIIMLLEEMCSPTIVPEEKEQLLHKLGLNYNPIDSRDQMRAADQQRQARQTTQNSPVQSEGSRRRR